MPLYEEITAQFLIENEFTTITAVPGYGATQIFDKVNELQNTKTSYSFHEESAYGIALGSAIAGKRSATLIKTHGLAKAANAAIDSFTTGCNAAFLIIACDDRTGLHSDSIFDAHKFAKGLGLPTTKLRFESPAADLAYSTEMSEKNQLPVVCIIDTANIGTICSSVTGIPRTKPRKYFRDLYRFDLCPLLADYQWNMAKSKMWPDADIVPIKPELITIPEDVQPKWRVELEKYQPYFDVFKRLRLEGKIGEIVCGDTSLPSLFAFPPYNCIDIVAYMGGSIPLSIGALLAGYEKSWAVIGDFSFIAAGNYGIIDGLNRNLPIKVLIFRNGVAGATGGQPVSREIFMRVLNQFNDITTIIKNDIEISDFESILESASNSDKPAIIVVEYD